MPHLGVTSFFEQIKSDVLSSKFHKFDFLILPRSKYLWFVSYRQTEHVVKVSKIQKCLIKFGSPLLMIL